MTTSDKRATMRRAVRYRSGPGLMNEVQNVGRRCHSFDPFPASVATWRKIIGSVDDGELESEGDEATNTNGQSQEPDSNVPKYSDKLVGNKIDDPVGPFAIGDIAISIYGRTETGNPVKAKFKTRCKRLMESEKLPANRAGWGKFLVSNTALLRLAAINGGELKSS